MTAADTPTDRASSVQRRATEIAREAITDTRLADGSDNLAAHVVIDRLISADLLRRDTA